MATAKRSRRDKHLQKVSHRLLRILFFGLLAGLHLNNIRLDCFRRAVLVRGAAQEVFGQQRSGSLEPARRTGIESRCRYSGDIWRLTWFNRCLKRLRLRLPSRSSKGERASAPLGGR